MILAKVNASEADNLLKREIEQFAEHLKEEFKVDLTVLYY